MTRKLKWTRHEDLAIDRRPCVGRQEYLDHMTFQSNDRPLFTEPFGPLIGLKEEWEEQGASPEELDFSAFRFRCEKQVFLPVHTGRMGGKPVVELEDNEEYRLYRDELGRTMQLPKATATLALPLDYPVKTMEDWLRIKPLYQYSDDRLNTDWEEIARAALAEDAVVAAGMPGGFDEIRELMGEEELCMAYYEQPELIMDILDTIGDTAQRVLDQVSATITIDVLHVHEDMAGKSGPLIGPVQVKETIVPYYRRIWDMVHARGTRLFDQDSDGDMNPVLDVFLEAGVNCMHPMEPAANMDVVKIREKYGTRLSFYGGLDKHVIRQGHAAIETELETKLPPMIRSGGCVLGLDHRIPNGTPLEAYRYYLERFWAIVDREMQG